MLKIHGVSLIQKKKIPDERGSIMHMLKANDAEFTKFGEVYFSTAYPTVIKGWHLHTKQTQNYVVIKGMIKLVLFDQRKESKTFGILEEHFIGDLNYSLCQIPPGVANGYKVIGRETAIICNNLRFKFISVSVSSFICFILLHCKHICCFLTSFQFSIHFI